MTGIELILSAVCNITSCELNQELVQLFPEGLPSLKIENDNLERNDARKMVNGNHFRVGSYNDSIRSRIEADDDGKLVGKGTAFRLLNELSEILNFTYELVLPPAYVDLQRKSMESWLVEMLIERQIDIAAAFIPITMERKHLISFSVETDTINCLRLLEGKFDLYKESLSAGDTVHLITASLWYLLIVSLIAYVTCLVFLTRLRSKWINDDEDSFTFMSSLSLAFRLLAKQGVQSPNASMTRILLITWSLFSMLVWMYYGAYVSQTYTRIAVNKKETIPQELTWLKYSGITLDYTDLWSCYSKITFDTRPSGFAYPRNTKLKLLFDKEIRNLYHSGYLSIIYERNALLATKVCSKLGSTLRHSLQMVNLAPVFYSWVHGIIAAISVLIGELIFKRFININRTLPMQTRTLTEELDNIVVQDDVAPPITHSKTSHQPAKVASSPFKRRIVNGRQYKVTRTRHGDARFIPIDTLSALLYSIDLYQNV